MEYQRGNFVISDDNARLDLETICGFLARSYWANNRPREIIEKALQHSLNFGIYDGTRQVGFARLVTDRATFAYLCDVFIDEEYRSQALGKWLMESVLAHPDVQTMRRFMLATRDAHGLYAQYGFTPLANTDRWMEIFKP